MTRPASARITSIATTNFGPLRNFTATNLQPDYNVLHVPNDDTRDAFFQLVQIITGPAAQANAVSAWIGGHRDLQRLLEGPSPNPHPPAFFSATMGLSHRGAKIEYSTSVEHQGVPSYRSETYTVGNQTPKSLLQHDNRYSGIPAHAARLAHYPRDPRAVVLRCCRNLHCHSLTPITPDRFGRWTAHPMRNYRLSSSADNLPALLHHLRSTSPGTLDKVTRLCRHALPNFREFVLPSHFRPEPELRWLDHQGDPHGLAETTTMAALIFRLAPILTMPASGQPPQRASSPSAGCVIVIDSIDQLLDERAAAVVAKALNGSRRNQIIATAASEDFAKRIPPRHLARF